MALDGTTGSSFSSTPENNCDDDENFSSVQEENELKILIASKDDEEELFIAKCLRMRPFVQKLLRAAGTAGSSSSSPPQTPQQTPDEESDSESAVTLTPISAEVGRRVFMRILESVEENPFQITDAHAKKNSNTTNLRLASEAREFTARFAAHDETNLRLAARLAAQEERSAAQEETNLLLAARLAAQDRRLEIMNDRLDLMITCRICMVVERQVAFLPCGHYVSCTACARVLRNCPICKCVFTSTPPIYTP